VQYQRFVIDVQQQQGKIIHLNAAQTHYLRRVLRLAVGDRAVAISGQGTAWLVQLTADKAEIIAPIEIQTELPVNVTLLVSLPKQGLDEIVRCCTEIGVTNIIPILSQRTLLKPSANKLTRWQRIAQEAAEQSERAIVPKIQEPIPLSAALSNSSPTSAHCYFCTARYDVPLLSTVLYGQLRLGDSVIIATGCEGGWTESEIFEAQEAQFQLVSLGRRILRAVTAPITAMSLIASLSEGIQSD